jgi:hypothetical protein
MAFDLYVTFAGLCLFKRRHDEPLRVLLPGPVPDHHAVVGCHARYAGTATNAAGDLWEHPIPQGGQIGLDEVRSTDALDRSLAGLHVVDLFALMQRPAERDRAFAEVVIGHGSACSPHPWERARGARWELAWPKGIYWNHMATAVTWRIRDVQDRIETNEEGIELTVRMPSGARRTLATLRPRGGHVSMYVFHAPRCELPSGDLGTCQENLAPGDGMPHFQAYYSLFDGESPACMPRFVDEGIWPLEPSEAAATDDVLIQADLLRERDAARGLGGARPQATDGAAPAVGREEQARFGRFYTCTAASTDEG